MLAQYRDKRCMTGGQEMTYAKMWHYLRRAYQSEEHGQVLVLMALALLALIGVTGLAIDVGLVMQGRRELVLMRRLWRRPERYLETPATVTRCGRHVQRSALANTLCCTASTPTPKATLFR